MAATPDQIAAAWKAFRAGRSGPLLGPCAAFVEAINAALALGPAHQSLASAASTLGCAPEEVPARVGEVVAALHDAGIEVEQDEAEAYRVRLKTLKATVAPGQGIVERVGWAKRFGVERFAAQIIFPNGPPDLTAAVVWRSLPVGLTIAPAQPVTTDTEADHGAY